VKNGAFQISREIFDNAIWEDVIKFRLFFFIVGNAVFSEGGVTKAGVKIERGQYLRSYRNLQKDLQYTENRAIKQYSLSVIKKKVDQLVKENRLKIEEAEPGTLFTVVNYALYQGLSNYKNVTENGARTAREQRENNNNNVKERKERKESLKPLVQEGKELRKYTESFNQFWSVYENKKGKAKASVFWNREVEPALKKGDITMDEILEGTQRYLSFCKQSGLTLKNGDTAINHEVWQDDWEWKGELYGEKRNQQLSLSKGGGYKNKTEQAADSYNAMKELYMDEVNQGGNNNEGSNRRVIVEDQNSLPEFR